MPDRQFKRKTRHVVADTQLQVYQQMTATYAAQQRLADTKTLYVEATLHRLESGDS